MRSKNDLLINEFWYSDKKYYMLILHEFLETQFYNGIKNIWISRKLHFIYKFKKDFYNKYIYMHFLNEFTCSTELKW